MASSTIMAVADKHGESECMKIDPLKNDLVLENMFRFCNVASLKNCRLVSRQWLDLSFKLWRNKALLKIGNNFDDYLPSKTFLQMLNPKRVDDSQQPSLQLRRYPFKAYFVEILEFKRGSKDYLERKRVVQEVSNLKPNHIWVEWKPESFDKFPEILSILNSVESLETLELTYFTSKKPIPDSIVPLDCSNIKRLKLQPNSYGEEHPLWPFLIKSCRKLEALSVAFDLCIRTPDLRNMHYDNPVDRMGIANLLKEMRRSRGVDCLSLKDLEIMDLHENGEERLNKPQNANQEAITVDALVECKFPLERLSIHLDWNHLEILLLPLLESYKDTLQYLSTSIFFRRDCFSKNEENIERKKHVRMEKLTEVYLGVNYGIDSAMFSLKHLELPQLKKLIVRYKKDCISFETLGQISMPFPEGKSFERLETLKLFDRRQILEEKTVVRLAAIMPNLKHLKILLDKASFPVICQHFKGLKTLHVLLGEGDYMELDDEALTGISKMELEEGGILPRRPNITDLERLSDLRISRKSEELQITEHSVIYGFLQLPKLYNLEVEIKGLSEEMRETLRIHVKGELELEKKLNPSKDDDEKERPMWD